MSQLSIILITGANQGLGWHACQQLVRGGKHHVLMGARAPQKGAEAIGKIVGDDKEAAGRIETIELDILSDQSIDAAVKQVQERFGRLDVLVNNAGAAYPAASKNDTLRAQYHELFDLNVFSHAIVTEKFLPLLRASKSPARRVVFTSSSLGSIGLAEDAKHPYYPFGLPIYRSSKAASNMLMVYYSKQLKDDGIAVNSICPGFCATNFNAFKGTDKPEDGGAAIVKAAVEGTNAEVNGTWANIKGPLPY